jgi:anti-sigma B factor antagonist
VSDQEQLTLGISVTPAGVAIVSAVGEIDLVSAPAFRRAISEALDRGTGAVVDLTKVAFIDSSGLLELHRASDTQRVVFVVPPGAIVARVIELGGLTEILTVFEDAENAERQAENLGN